jgi:hypothetical protein
MTKTRVVDNRNRPARPEPNEDEAIEKPPSIREGSERVSTSRESARRDDAQTRRNTSRQ